MYTCSYKFTFGIIKMISNNKYLSSIMSSTHNKSKTSSSTATKDINNETVKSVRAGMSVESPA